VQVCERGRRRRAAESGEGSARGAGLGGSPWRGAVDPGLGHRCMGTGGRSGVRAGSAAGGFREGRGGSEVERAVGRWGGGVRQGAAWAAGDRPDAGGEPVGAHDCSAAAHRLCAGRGVWRPSDSPASSRDRLSWPARCADGQLSVRSWPAYPAARWSWVSNLSVSSCSTRAWSHPWRAARLMSSCRSGW
jgi:hypothetical protein